VLSVDDAVEQLEVGGAVRAALTWYGAAGRAGAPAVIWPKRLQPAWLGPRLPGPDVNTHCSGGACDADDGHCRPYP
jgi:hypothetical protein